MKKICPIIKSECLQHGCEFYVHLIGKHPQTGADQDEWNCAIAWLPMLLIENAGMVRKNVASTDKVATETAMTRNMFFAALPPEAQQRLLDAAPKPLTEGKNQQTGSQP